MTRKFEQPELPWIGLVPAESARCRRCGGSLSDPLSKRYRLGPACHRAALGYPPRPPRPRRPKPTRP